MPVLSNNSPKSWQKVHVTVPWFDAAGLSIYSYGFKFAGIYVSLSNTDIALMYVKLPVVFFLKPELHGERAALIISVPLKAVFSPNP